MATATDYPVDVNEVPLTVNISIPIGDAYRRLWTLQRDTGTAAATTLTGITWALVVSDKQGGTAVLSKTTTADWTASGVHVDTAASGQFSVYILGADCTTLTTGAGWWELQATFASGHADFPSMVKTLMQGTLTIEADAVTPY